MTTTDDYRRLHDLLAADPHDDHTRAVLADLCDERHAAGATRRPCPACEGKAHSEGRVAERGPYRGLRPMFDCLTCHGTGTAPHDYRAEAFGHRLRLACKRLREGVECGTCKGEKVSGSYPKWWYCLACRDPEGQPTGRVCGPAHDPEGWKAYDDVLAAYAGEEPCPTGLLRPQGGVSHWGCGTCAGTGRVPDAVGRALALRRAADTVAGPWRSDCTEGRRDNERRQHALTVRYLAAISRVRADVQRTDYPRPTVNDDWDVPRFPADWFRHGVLWTCEMPWEVWARVGERLYSEHPLVGGVTLTTEPPDRGELARRWPGLRVTLPGAGGR